MHWESKDDRPQHIKDGLKDGSIIEVTKKSGGFTTTAFYDAKKYKLNQ